MEPKISVETGFEGGHGSHWDAVLEDPGELGRVVAEVYKRGSADPPVVLAIPAGLAKVRYRALPFGNLGFEARVVEVTVDGDEKPRIATVYPYLKPASRALSCSPIGSIEWGDGTFEAEVRVRLVHDQSELTFFATDYFLKRAEYRSGEPGRVAISAVAYTAGTISQKERLEAFAGGEVDVSSSTIIAPLKDGERAPYYDDDYFLQGALIDCRPFAYPPWGEGAILRLDLGDLGSVPVAARKKDFPHGWPVAGEYVAAYCWLQGRILELEPEWDNAGGGPAASQKAAPKR